MPTAAKWLAKHPMVLYCMGAFMLGIATVFVVRGIYTPLTVAGIITGIACLVFGRRPELLEKIHREN